MQIISINVAMPKTIDIKGRPVLTAIYKEPVADSVWLGPLGLSGDGQADLTVHGGEHQAESKLDFLGFCSSGFVGC